MTTEPLHDGRAAARARRGSTAAGVWLAGMLAIASACARPSAPAIEIQTDDVTRFFRVYEAASGHPTAEAIQREYLDPGSPGLHHLAAVRNVTGARIAQAMAADPALYANARSCLAALPRVRARLRDVFGRLLVLYPEAQRPPVTILVSRGRPLAISGPGRGVQIGLEAMCSPLAASVLDADVDDRFVHVIAHEYIHAQQAPALADTEALTVLERSLGEGGAEFLGELISGGLANVAVHASAKGRETAIETRFAADLDDRDLSAWFDNTTAGDPGQLGYWVGYRIARAYYQHASDKAAAVRDIVQVTDAHAFLARSGWHPGIVLD